MSKKEELITTFCATHLSFLNARIAKAICVSKPTTLSDLLSIKGVGKATVKKFGTVIISLFADSDDDAEVAVVGHLTLDEKLSQGSQNAIDLSSDITENNLETKNSTKSLKRKSNQISLKDQPVFDLTGGSPEIPTINVSNSSSSSTSSSNSTSSSSTSSSSSIQPIITNTEGFISSKLLTQEQLSVAAKVLNGDSIFLTGAAGTGKSFLFRYIIQELKKKFTDNESIAITAPTGIAAINVNGQTIHSWAGIRQGKGDAEALCTMVAKDRKASRRWRNCKVLLIDEISMVDSDLFSKLSEVGKHVRANAGGRHFSFGGLQLVCCGDFFQLPPVALSFGKHFCFQTNEWLDLQMTTCTLTKVIRQQSDPLFKRVLNQIRQGYLSEEAKQLLHRCHLSRKPMPNDDILPTKLYCTNRNVDYENHTRLRDIQSKSHFFTCTDNVYQPPDCSPNYMRQALEKLNQMANQKTPSRLELKIGAQVVLLRNLDETLANGSRGVVIGFKTYVDAIVEVKEELDVDVMLQGAPEDFAEVFRNPKESLIYVLEQNEDGVNEALHLLVKQRQELETESTNEKDKKKIVCMKYLESLMTKILMRNQMVIDVDNDEDSGQHSRATKRRKRDEGQPIVRFDNGRTITVAPVQFTCSFGKQKGAMSRTQIPLKLAWALTIHKSQGITLTRCQVQAADAFTYGQTYVALSRCVSSAGLWLSGADVTQKSVKVHKDVLTFMGVPLRPASQPDHKPLTEEQKARIAKNKAKALEKLKNKRLKQLQEESLSSSSSSSSSSTTPSTSSSTTAFTKISSATKAFYAKKNQNGVRGVSSASESTMTSIPEGEQNCLKDMAFVVTGVLPSLSRDDAKNLIEKYGGIWKKSVSKKTTYLVTGELLEDGRTANMGSKFRDAKKKNVEIINQQQFLALISNQDE